jgi:hypothetical protein
MIAGTDQSEIVMINRISDLYTSVGLLKAINEKEYSDTIYYRIFNHNETKVISLFGLGGKDIFVANGESRKGVLIQMVGGEDNDVYIDNTVNKRLRHVTMIFDNKEGNQFIKSGRTKIIYLRYPSEFSYDRKGFKRAYSRKKRESKGS